MANKEYNTAIEYLESLGVHVDYLPVPENPMMEGTRVKFNFLVDFTKGDTTESFYFSQSHREQKARAGDTLFTHEKRMQKQKANNRQPDLWALLGCLSLDARISEEPFEDWAADLGYNPDSRKAERSYHNMRNNVRKARRIFDLGDIQAYLEENRLD